MARNMVWKRLNRPELGLCNSISDVIYRAERRNDNLLTSVRTGNTLFLASDYSGNYKGSHYESISFLVADSVFLGLWDDLRKRVRREVLKDDRSMSFKKLNDDRRARALMPFLQAANIIPGLLITFLIDKEVIKRLSIDVAIEKELSIVEISEWNKKSFDKVNRISHLGAMLIASMSAPGQNVIWITDEDEIAPNISKLTEVTKIIGHFLNHYCMHDMGHFRFGTTKSDSGSKELEDLVALPDLAAGALTEVMTVAYNGHGVPQPHLYLPASTGISRKAHAILVWLSDKLHSLKKLIICIDYTDSNTCNIRLIDTLLEIPMRESN